MSEAKATAGRIRIVKVEQRLDCQPYRVYRAWSSPDALTTWYPDAVEGSLQPGARQFRWPWTPAEDCVTTVNVTVTPRGYGSIVSVEDGPFDLSQPGVSEAYADCLFGWGEALANLRAVMDFSVDLRRYRSG
jgi:uncharacterized protein YndB with AHSA1/START domain